MQLVGVIDLLRGRAVRARGGIRDRYVAVDTIGGTRIDGDPLALARGYVDRFGLTTLYAADLDAITGSGSNGGLLAELAGVAPLWADAGISSTTAAEGVIGLGAARAVVGLETLASFDALSAICAAVGGNRVAFSLDVRNGDPVTTIAAGSVEHIAARAVRCGAGVLIVIDLARVGAATGPDFEMVARVRAAAPETPLFVGGGVRGPADLARLADTGCSGALVASALHDGALSATR
jgi:phosphoribosylformimino-5-aminoimidazole carboxamide ribotide isomerase